MSSGVAWTKEETERAKEMRAAGAQLEEISAALGRTINAVKNRLRYHAAAAARWSDPGVNRRSLAALARDPHRKTRNATIAFELAFCEWADRHPGIEISPYVGAP